MVSLRTINQAVKLLVEASHPLKIILFGSYARESQREDSDADLLVILPTSGASTKRWSIYDEFCVPCDYLWMSWCFPSKKSMIGDICPVPFCIGLSKKEGCFMKQPIDLARRFLVVSSITVRSYRGKFSGFDLSLTCASRGDRGEVKRTRSIPRNGLLFNRFLQLQGSELIAK